MKKYINLLQNMPLFQDFSYAQLDLLLLNKSLRLEEYKKNVVVYSQNQKCNYFDIVCSGLLSVQKIDSSGNVLTISDFITGDVLGGNLIFSPKSFYPMTVIAKSYSVILHIEKDFVLELCQSNKMFLVSFLQSISDKTIILTNKIKSLTMKTIRQCIIEFLLVEYYSQNSTTIKLSLSKKELAESFGIQRPSLSRELNKMRSDGLIEFDPYSITIKDVPLLSMLRVHT